jgi:hypothetical protein
MGNNLQTAVKTVNNLIGMDKDAPLEKLPDGEKYFGFVNVSSYFL